MLILGVDSSSVTASAALAEDGKTVVNMFINDNKTHSQKLLGLIDTVIKTAGKTLKDIDYIAFSNGPGSFTGLRIGAATVKGLCHAAGKKALPVSTMDALFENVRADIVCPMLDARRNEVYTAVYENGKKIINDAPMPLDRLIELLPDGEIVFLGDGAAAYREYLTERLGKNALFAPEQNNFVSAAGVIKAGLKLLENGLAVDYNEINPNYLRVSQAERLRNK